MNGRYTKISREPTQLAHSELSNISFDLMIAEEVVLLH